MFSKLKELFNASNPAYINAKKILCPVEGEVVSIKEVNDPTFSEEILGIGLAVKPSVGRVVSPVDGTVALMFDTGHAVSIVADNGAEILIHVGLDTVALKGLHYTVHCATDDKVKSGQLLIEFDIDGIKADGYDIITPVVICNSSD
ncbi:MAG: PTS glucose transporter subunit IIA, partial [Oscillospiraceae bacterium]